MFDPDISRHPVSTTTRVAAVGDGSLVAWTCLFDRSHADCGLVNGETNGFVPMEFGIMRSKDSGRTWTAIQKVNLPSAWHEFETCSPVIQVAKGRWLVPTSPVKNFAGEETNLPPGLAWWSQDEGKTWPGSVTLFDSDPAGMSALEQKLTRLSDGRWLAVCWSIDRNGKTAPNRYSIGDEQGRQFGPWKSTEILGETCTPIALPQQHVLCVYRSFQRPGLWARLSRIEGDSWIAVSDLCLWDGSAAPRADQVERSSELRQMKNLRFGYPSLAILPGGDVMVVFWCVEECVSNIRWIRMSPGVPTENTV
jgi:hypothetical protein